MLRALFLTRLLSGLSEYSCVCSQGDINSTDTSGSGLRRRKVMDPDASETTDKENMGRGMNASGGVEGDDVKHPIAAKRRMVDVGGARQHLGEALGLGPKAN